jgi:hypothetical protein
MAVLPETGGSVTELSVTVAQRMPVAVMIHCAPDRVMSRAEPLNPQWPRFGDAYVGRGLERTIPSGGEARYEVDVFKGKHRGLVIAENELPTEQAGFERPVWLRKKVTGEKHYYNATLAGP